MTLPALAVFRVSRARRGSVAYAIPLISITCFLFWLQRRILGRKGYVALTGKGGSRRLAQTGPFRFVLLGSPSWSRPRRLPALRRARPGRLQQGVGPRLLARQSDPRQFPLPALEQLQRQQTILHSFTYSAATACIAIVLALGIAYIVSRRLVPFGQALTFLCMAPFVVPGIVLAIGFYAATRRRRMSLYGTAAILILAFTTRFLPIGLCQLHGGLARD